MSIMAKTPSGYKKIGSAYLGERPVDKVFNANGDVVYALQRDLTGVPPLLFKGKEQSELLNYRIYGDTVDGESVGDRTGNLFDGIFLQGCWLGSDGSFQASSKWICTQKMPCKANTDYTFTFGIKSRWYGFAWYDIDGNYIESNGSTIERPPNIFTAISPANAVFMVVNIAGDHIGTAPLDIHPSDVTDFMLVEGSTPLPYEPYGYKVPVTISNSTDTLTTPIYLPEPIKMVGDEAEYIDYGEQKLHRVRKNLLQNTATSTTKNGVTFTVNSDGSVTCNGTADKAAWFAINKSFDVYSPDGRIASIGNQGSLDTFYMNIGFVSGNVINSQEYSKTTHNNSWIHIVIASGYTCDNLTLYPMIRKADIEDDTYEPYIENTDLDVTLPALPTIKGTNQMSIDTEVQPSRMDIKGRIKSLT